MHKLYSPTTFQRRQLSHISVSEVGPRRKNHTTAHVAVAVRPVGVNDVVAGVQFSVHIIHIYESGDEYDIGLLT